MAPQRTTPGWRPVSAAALLVEPRDRVVGHERPVRVDRATGCRPAGARRRRRRRSSGVDRALGEVEVLPAVGPRRQRLGQRAPRRRGRARAISGVAAIATGERDELRRRGATARRRPRAGGPAHRRAGAARPAAATCSASGPTGVEEGLDAGLRERAEHRESETNGRRALGVHVQPHQRLGRHPGERVDLGREGAQAGAASPAPVVVGAEHRAVDDHQPATAQERRAARASAAGCSIRNDVVTASGAVGRPGAHSRSTGSACGHVPQQHPGVRRLDVGTAGTPAR